MFESIKKALEILKNPPDPNWHVEKSARPSEKYPLAGFWQRQQHHDFGLAIGPAGDGNYYISFCGPGGCFEKGTYRPISQIFDDPDIKVIDMETIEVRGKKNFKRYVRSSKRSVTMQD